MVRHKYFHRSRISEKKFRELIRLFSLDMEALKISALTGLNRNTVNHVLMLLRERLSDICESEAHFDHGSFECDESYFGARRIRGKRGRGALGKTIVFGIYQRRTKKVYTSVVEDVKSKTLIEIIERKIPTTSIVYTDGFRSYIPLFQHGYKRHETVNHGVNEFVRKGSSCEWH